MNFLAFIIALSLHQVVKPGNAFQGDHWLKAFDQFLAGFLGGTGLRTLVTLAALAFAATWVIDVLDDWLFGLPALAASALLLLWSLGREDYHTALERFEARAGTEPEAACDAVGELWAPLDEVLDAGDETETALQRLAYAGYERWFGPVFFFVVAGPVGSFLYRALAVLVRQHEDDASKRILHWIDWLPSRLLALTFALTGDFMAVAQNHPLPWFLENRSAPQVLRETAACACTGAEGARAIGSIMYRSAGLWLLLVSFGFILL